MEQQAEISFSLTTLDSHLSKFNDTLGQITKSVASIQESVKDDPELNKKILQAAQTYQQNSAQFTELVNILQSANLQGLQSSVASISSSLSLMEKNLGAWAKSSNSLAWNLGPRMSAIESTQASLDAKVSTLQKDTFDMKTMLTELYKAFKGSSTPTASLDPPTPALTSSGNS